MSSKQPIKLTEAAKRLGLTRQAVHVRIQRGQLEAYQDEQGHWWVPWPPDDMVDTELVDNQFPAVPNDLTVSLSTFVEGVANLSHVIEEQEETIRDLQASNRELQASVQELTAQLRAQHERQPSRDEWIVERVREINEEKPHRRWWKLW
jgi:hypothetical protein